MASSTSSSSSSQLSRVKRWAERKFGMSERGTSFNQEVRAGTVTFLTMAYILLVNPLVLGYPHTGMPRTAVIVGTALSSAVGTFICGWFGNLPFGLAPGLGLSAYFSYGVVKGSGLAWEGTLATCLVAGCTMLFLAVTRMSDSIMRYIPKTVKLATVAGMGLLLTFIAMQTMQLVVKDHESLVKLGQLLRPELLISLLGLWLLATLVYHGIRGAILIGILSVTLVVWAYRDAWPSQVVQLPTFPSAFPAVEFGFLSSRYVPPLLAFLSVGIFDVSGVLFGLSKLLKLTRRDGSIPGSVWAFIGASVGTIVASLFNCSPVIIHVESAAGIKDGGRTGLASVVTSMWFLLSLFFAPLFDSVPYEATSPVMILIGAMMIGETSEIAWKEMDCAVPAFLTLAMMPFSFSIPNGILFGLIAHILLYVSTGRMFRDIKRWWERRQANVEQGELTWINPKSSDDTLSINESYERYVRRPSLVLRREEYEM